MKQLFTLSFFFLLNLAVSAQVDVTFAVDMTGQTDVTAAFIAGEIQSTQWTPGEGALNDDDGNAVWARTYSLAPGTYLYKFGIGNDWGSNEGGGLTDCGVDDGNGGFNRTITVEEGTPQTLIFLYDSCAVSDLPIVAAAATVSVTFAVDVTAIADVSAVFVAGNFQDPEWQPGDGALADDDGNGVWARTYELAPGDYSYKFGIGTDWGVNEGGGIAACATDDNRTLTVAESDTTLIFIYDSCNESNIPIEGDAPDGLVDVVFSVDMTGQTDVTAAFVAGEFQGWAPPQGALEDPDANGIWRRTYRLMPGATSAYKFGIGADWGNNEGGGLADCGIDDGNGGFNRSFTIPEDATETVYLSFVYDGCDVVDVTSTDNGSTLGNVSVAPNPMGDITRITFDNAGNATHDVFLTNMAGQTVRSYRSVSGNQLDVARGNLAPGLYFVTFQNDAGEQGSLKLVVR